LIAIESTEKEKQLPFRFNKDDR